jgi:hypothetical protein
MPQNMSFGSNGLDLVRLLRNIPMQLCLANLCVNGTCWASFATTFVQQQNNPKHMFWVKWSGSGAVVVKKSDTTSFGELVR